MKLHWPKKKRVRMGRFLLVGLTLTILAACGGGGSSSEPTAAPMVAEFYVAFKSTVLDHFQDEIVTLQNNGTASVSIGQVAHTNPLEPPFSISEDTCSGKTLRPSETCALQVRFSPTVQATFDDAFDISATSGQGLMNVYVSGDAKALNLSINQRDVSACPTIRLFVAVTDSSDDPVISLTDADFSIFEEGSLQGIDNFSNTVTAPISIALALDYSGSIQPFIDEVESAAVSFIDQLDLDNHTDEAAIIKFAASIDTIQSFTDVHSLLKSAIEADFSGDTGATRLYDAIWQAVDITADPARNDRRAIVVLSDGIDEGPSDHDLTEVIDRAHEKGVPVFTIGMGNAFLPALQKLADETGGQFFFSPTSTNLQDIYWQIAQILTNQYVIEYHSPSSGAGTLDVEVDSNGRQGEDTRDFGSGC